MDISKQINNLKKQNDGMENGFKNKGIEFNKTVIDETADPATQLSLLTTYNAYLKELSKNNRPPPQVKQVAPTPPAIKEPINVNEDEDDDPHHKEVKPNYSTITNMEDIKRAFFNGEYDTFNQLVKHHPLKYYKVNYKYSSDNNGRPAFVAKNLLRGFVQGLDDYRKYFMVCFRCILVNKDTNEYRYPSYWVVNTNDDLKTIMGSQFDDYDFISVTEDDAVAKLLKKMERNRDENDDALIGEVYLH